MKNQVKTMIGVLVIGMALLSACKVNKVGFSDKKVAKPDQIALISTFLQVGNASGGLHASVMNSKIEAIADELILMFEPYPNIYRENVASILKEELNCDVLYGEPLQSMPGFEKLKQNNVFTNTLTSEYEIFPDVFQATNDINPFETAKDFETEKSPEVKSQIMKTCEGLNVNFVAVSYTRLWCLQGNAFEKGRMYLTTVLYIYDKDGDCIAWGTQSDMTGVPFSANKIEKVQDELDKYPELVKQIISKMGDQYTSL